MKRSENISDLAQALNKCQVELKDVFKGTQAYNYMYATLSEVYDEIRPKMTLHGLALTHEKSFNRLENTIELNSLLMHTSGEWIEYHGSLPFASINKMNDFQASGSGFTYLERYQTSAIFAITSDEDSDAQGEQDTKALQLATQDQVNTINTLLSDTATDIITFLGFYKVKAVSELNQPNAVDAISKLSKKAKS